jgi:hypothetical protein
MHPISFVSIEVLIVVALIPDLLAEGYIEAHDLLPIVIYFGLQVYVVAFLYFFQFLEALIPLLALLLLLFTELVLVLLLFTVADLVQVILQRTLEAVLE